jgi:hypothetical protein
MMVGTVSPAGAERNSEEPVVGIVPGIVAARVPEEMQVVRKMVPGLRWAFYLPAVFLEAWKRQAGSPAPVRVHSFHKNEHSPVALPHRIDNVAC